MMPILKLLKMSQRVSQGTAALFPTPVPDLTAVFGETATEFIESIYHGCGIRPRRLRTKDSGD